jgi:hypothetical protein
MNWDKINIKAILTLLRHMEKNTPTIDGEYTVAYSDGKEELKISYKKHETK